MMFVMKRKKVILVAILLGVTVFALGVAKETVFPGKETFLPSEGRCVIIDAGHGFPDGGAVGQSGVLEKDINLNVAMNLQSYMESNGTNIILTRSDDNGIYDIQGSIKNKKVSDIKNREKIIDESDADIFISIHMNKFPQEQYSGPQVFYSANNPDSELLAKCIQNSMTAALNPQKKREIKKADGSIYLLKNAQIPAVLVECGFLSNSEEEKKLIDEKYQRQLAWSIYCGIVEYFNEK